MSDSDAEFRSGESGNKGFFSRLASGDFGLAKTYWLYGLVISVAINMALKVVTSLGVLAVAILAVTLYQVIVLLGIWRAASRYQGWKVWAILAKIATVLGWLSVLASVGVFIQLLS